MHLTPMSIMENTEIVGVCDIKGDRANAAGKKYNAKVYTDYKKMITELKPDIVHVYVPHYLHPFISKFALENGVNVLCEKPMAINLQDGIENVKIAKEKGLVYGIIFQCRI